MRKTVFMTASHLFTTFFIIYVILGAGCSAPRIKTPILTEVETSPDLDTTSIEITEQNYEEAAGDSSCNIDIDQVIDSLVQNARILCSWQDYSQAHTALLSSISLIESKDGLAQEEWNDSNNYFMQIADLYINSLPNEYLDSIPSNIMGMIFRYQMSMVTDTFSLSDTILSNLDCIDGAPYNIPLVYNKRVQNSLAFIVTRRKHTMENLLSRSHYFLPLMQKLLAEHNLPTDLSYLPILESGYNPYAYSYAHASGLWQFIPSTGKIYGLRINYWLDERRDPLKSTVAAIQYLKKLYNDFNDWYLALAAYNCGEGRVSRALARSDNTDYWSLRLPRQTMNYVPQFIAYQIIGKNPQCFGFTISPEEPFAFDTVHLSDCIDLNKIAEGIGIEYTALKRLNPHITRWCTPPDIENVTVYLPPGLSDTCKKFFTTLSDEDKVRWYRYRIKSGDNLISIARRFKVSVNAIKSVNKLRSSFIVAGRSLYIPIPVSKKYPPISSHNPSQIAQNKQHRPSSTVTDQELKNQGTSFKYTIRFGETLYGIAEQYNMSVQEICRWNCISNPRMIRAGTVLTLYEKSKVKNRTTAVATESPANKKVYTVQAGDNLYSIAQQLGITMQSLAQWNNKNLHHPLIHPNEILVYYQEEELSSDLALKSNNENTDEMILYKVKRGDNLSALCELFSVNLATVLKMNNLKTTSVIRPGDIIKIPITGRKETKDY